jgi:hypothetical protein
MRRFLLAFALTGGLAATSVAAQTSGQGGTVAGPGDGLVVALWLMWLATFVAFTIVMHRLLEKGEAAPAVPRSGETTAERLRRAA